MKRLEDIKGRIWREIPLSQHMGVEVDSVEPNRVVLKAPLELNSNHRMTAFGGSIYSLAALACWSLVSEALTDEEVDVDYVVIQDGQMDYMEPIAGDFKAEAKWSAADREKFISSVRRKGRARATLTATVGTGARPGARMIARFVAQTEKYSHPSISLAKIEKKKKS